MKTLDQMARLGEKLQGTFIVDAHGHIGPWHAFPIPQQDAESMLRVMDAIGVSVSCLSGMPALSACFTQGNDMALEAASRHPTRFKVYAAVFPNHQDGGLPEVERCIKAGAAGIKVHSIHGKPYDHKDYHDAFAYANEHQLPVLAHTWGGRDVEVLMRIAKSFPKASFICGHSGVLDVPAYCAAGREQPNLYLETCTSMTPRGLVETLCREAGPHKVLFGSDMVFISLAQQIGRVLFADLSEADKRLVLGENARRLFRLRDAVSP